MSAMMAAGPHAKRPPHMALARAAPVPSSVFFGLVAHAAQPTSTATTGLTGGPPCLARSSTSRSPPPPRLARGRSRSAVQTDPGPTPAAIETLITGQVANFTLKQGSKPAPAASFVDGGGRPVGFADFRGKVVLVNVWATWCAPCVREMPTLARLEAELGGDGFAVVAVAVDRRGLPEVDRFYAKHGIEGLPAFADTGNAVPRALGVVGLPTTVLLDRQGREIGRLVGGAEWDSPEAVALLRYFVAAS